jgi:hypothetical protein
MKEFESYKPAKPRVFSFEDDTHTPLADPLQDAVMLDRLADHGPALARFGETALRGVIALPASVCSVSRYH